ncbi:hypothetical protein BIV57_07435 [Mangrovactinospora gilvigrisea]|uniref:PrsW family intramembrane metalloprotease n=1 Tax=Mangrovactinospora gilvigrisea TaxID=1428644 RepID=A0A1J7CEM7_9ACTN|nr:hypothetical protein BIV57_07435 [Mangrovactinospora gilvigrisea]
MLGVVLALAGCAVTILALIERQTGGTGFTVGLLLAVLPVPLVVGGFLWLDRTEPQPRRRLAFCFAWGAFAATLMALLANSWTTSLLEQRNGARGEMVGSSTLVPLVEETAKGLVVLGLFLLTGRRGGARRVVGPVGGLVLAGVTAAGFAFTENVLYLGRAYASGAHLMDAVQLTFGTLFVRAVLSPFAHPLFTCMTGLGLGLGTVARRRVWQVLAPLLGWTGAMALHGLWNAAAGGGMDGFLRMYSGLMVPIFLGMLTVVLLSRRRELRLVVRHLAPYAGAGWMAGHEPAVLGSAVGRRAAMRAARRGWGEAGAVAVREYTRTAVELARLRATGAQGARFFEREQELLHRLWMRRAVVGPVLAAVPPPAESDRGCGPRRPAAAGGTR